MSMIFTKPLQGRDITCYDFPQDFRSDAAIIMCNDVAESLDLCPVDLVYRIGTKLRAQFHYKFTDLQEVKCCNRLIILIRGKGLPIRAESLHGTVDRTAVIPSGQAAVDQATA